MNRPALQKIRANATWAALLATSLALLAACGSAPPAPPRQVQEYARHTAVGLEKHRDGQIGEARNAFLRALARAELDDDAGLIATALLNLGATELLLDLNAEAGRSYARASREAQLAGQPGLDWQAISGLAETSRRLGQPAKALELFAVRPEPGKAIDDAVRGHADISRARALADSGQGAAALGLLDSVIKAAQARPQPDPALAAAWHALATIRLAQGETAAARGAATAALELDRARHHPPSVADDHRLLGKIAAAQNDAAQARFHAQRALAIFANTGQEKRAAESRIALQPGAAAP
ncbi:MAG TPA: hypothetical protein VFH22_00535 [Rhodocyclaceae bacterium]|nr:hypothetical protein [Rhodocyclaceae bacterium]